ncbi:Multidrug efflux RND transporter permease subunit [Sulfidibacter corallicola]|uniref:Multidrug efflux RND transporter permease subunit n=1 Tax=Sulfidibacter corallicola TaxID=2818388 RepID=A0A8A4TGU6_SULCO|nr:multidrug efflux RND transporter permease subunit [Sulfidibacter corallicola]QTD48434.1 multidrug efflux RND transporter permease subunit [Sulfidibacter corallicola]
MKFTHIFADRPIFATVLSLLIVIVGAISYFTLPVSQMPQIAPPTIVVSANYPGASAATISDTVATPLEQAINGVENMLYMLSQSTGDGQMQLTITFELGTDLEEAQVLVQNRVAIAEPRLPEEVRRIGVTTQKSSPNLMMVIHLFSPDNSFNQLDIGNYATFRMKDVLARVEGVGDIFVFGSADYAMRVWLDPDRLHSLNMTAGDVIEELRAKNVQVAAGVLNQQPQPHPSAFELSVQTQGRLQSPQEFEDIIIKAENGRVVKLGDVARIELGAQTYATRSYLNAYPAVALAIFQRPGTNAIATADELLELTAGFAENFPPGLAYDVVYNPTAYVEESIVEVYRTLAEAIILVVLVVLLFLHSVRAALIPIVAIPVSLIGTFAVLASLGYSLNTLTLFGLVLSIGIVVDDAIVVVENVERNLRKGMSPRDAVHTSMDEVGIALVAMALVLVAVFLPAVFIPGISGQFYRAFAITITVSTVISGFVSLTLSPALAVILLRPHKVEEKVPLWRMPFHFIVTNFERILVRLTAGYAALIKRLVRMGALAFVIYLGLIGLTWFQFDRTPTGFIPPQDQGYFICAMQLPPGASLERTDKVVREAIDRLLAVEGVRNTVAFGGFSGATFTSASNAAAIFITLEDFETREAKGVTFDGLLGQLNGAVAQIQEAFTIVIPPPAVQGIGNGGGFTMMIQDREGQGYDALLGATWAMAGAAMQDPSVSMAFTTFETQTPQLYLDVDRERAERLGVDISELFQTLEVFLGSAYVNDFNMQGRTFRVVAQAQSDKRLTPDDILRLNVRNREGLMVPTGSVASIADHYGPSRVPRFNLYSAAAMQGNITPGYSTGQVLDKMEQLATQVLPRGFSFEWTDLALQQRKAGDTAGLVFGLAVLFVFLLLAAQYESWSLPLAVILIVPMCLLSAITGVIIAGMDNNILTQIGFVVLIGLASKNAILIVEFAKQQEDRGLDRFTAAIESARLRLRPILMTSFSFILGVIPLVFATGAGAEMRQAIGIAVFSGMLGVTFFGLLLTPIFYTITRTPLFSRKKQATESADEQTPPPSPTLGEAALNQPRTDS